MRKFVALHNARGNGSDPALTATSRTLGCDGVKSLELHVACENGGLYSDGEFNSHMLL